MRDDVIPGLDPGPIGPAWDRSRTGRPQLRPLTRGRAALLLAAAVGLPWIVVGEAPRGDLPMQRARNLSGSPVCQAALGPAGSLVATVDDRGRVALRPVVEGRGGGRPLDLPGFGMVSAFAPDGRHLAVGRRDQDLLLCDLRPGGRARPLSVPARGVCLLAFAPDGRTLAVSSAGRPDVLLWDVGAGQPRMTLRGHAPSVGALAFAPDGRSLATAGTHDGEVLIRDADTGRLRHRLPVPSAIRLAYAPDGRTLAAVGRAVRLWDTRTGRLLRTIGEGRLLYWADYSPDGRALATAAGDGTASLWDAETGRELRRLDGRAGLLRWVAFTPDGRLLIAIGDDGDIRTWHLDDPEAAG